MENCLVTKFKGTADIDNPRYLEDWKKFVFRNILKSEREVNLRAGSCSILNSGVTDITFYLSQEDRSNSQNGIVVQAGKKVEITLDEDVRVFYAFGLNQDTGMTGIDIYIAGDFFEPTSDIETTYQAQEGVFTDFSAEIGKIYKFTSDTTYLNVYLGNQQIANKMIAQTAKTGEGIWKCTENTSTFYLKNYGGAGSSFTYVKVTELVQEEE